MLSSITTRCSYASLENDGKSVATQEYFKNENQRLIKENEEQKKKIVAMEKEIEDLRS